MNESGRRRAAFVALLVTTGAPMLTHGAGADDDAAHWAQVRDCAARGDSRARHACVDEVLRAAGVLTREAEHREQRQRFGLEKAAPPAPAAAPAPAPGPAPAPAPTPPPATASSSTDELQVQVASARTGADRRLVFTTTDGAVWRQVESQEIPRGPQAGDTIVIHRASLGSFLCELPRRASWRCARTR